MTDSMDAQNEAVLEAPGPEFVARQFHMTEDLLVPDLNITLQNFVARKSHMTEDLLDFLGQYGSGLGPDTVGSKFNSQHGEDQVASNVWYDVSRSPLPHAPSMRIFCLYGTGLPTERAYYYKRNWEEQTEETTQRILSEPAVIIDPVADDSKSVKHGIRYGVGDGSVPLLSLGYICADAWRREDSGLNPSKAKVYTREYLHKAEFCVDDPMRSGPSSSDHVDILGNSAMMEDFLKIVTDFEPQDVTNDHIVSDIREIAQKINSHPHGGIFKKKRWFQR
jgi:phospholipid:diacylglycerol acyltransferase